jgi:hypothetical protein
MIALRDLEVAVQREARDLISGYQSKLNLVLQTSKGHSTPAAGPGRPFLGPLLFNFLANGLALRRTFLAILLFPFGAGGDL